MNQPLVRESDCQAAVLKSVFHFLTAFFKNFKTLIGHAFNVVSNSAFSISVAHSDHQTYFLKARKQIFFNHVNICIKHRSIELVKFRAVTIDVFKKIIPQICYFCAIFNNNHFFRPNLNLACDIRLLR